MWDSIISAWHEIRKFFDRLVGWLYYVLGDYKDPYVYESFFENKED